MVFSSTVFVFLFLPIVLIWYYTAKEQYKNIVLLVASLLFYAYGEPRLVILMIISIVMNWGMARLLSYNKELGKKKLSKMWLVLSILVNFGMLFVFKYLDFSITIANKLFGLQMQIVGIALPIGISFYTFQAMSYVIDVYRGNGKAQNNILNVGLYISFFPQLVAGPIVRYQTFITQLDNRKVRTEVFGAGIKRFICGFCKKVILANNLALVAEQMFGTENYSMLPVGYAWIGAIAYTLQIYYDFAGYSDMAIGLGQLFGFSFPENFNYPYIASTVTDFWRRWHISLSEWFRDYVYIPIGGSRVKVGRHIFNMFVVWALTGLWHGANYTFVVWGMIYFLFLVIEKYFVRPEERRNIFVRIVWRVVTLCVIIFAWVFFNSVNLRAGISYCMAMLGMTNNMIWDDTYIFIVRENLIYLIVGMIFALPVSAAIKKNISNKYINVWSKVSVIVYLLGFMWAVSFLILGAHNPFIYFNF